MVLCTRDLITVVFSSSKFIFYFWGPEVQLLHDFTVMAAVIVLVIAEVVVKSCTRFCEIKSKISRIGSTEILLTSEHTQLQLKPVKNLNTLCSLVMKLIF